MKIEIRQHDQVAVVCVIGSVDGTTAPMLTAELHACVTSGNVHLVADLAGVDYTSSVGLRTLLATMKETRVHGGDLRLSNVTPHVLKVLELSGFTSIMKLYDDVDSAVDSYAV
ncbi:MAG TPA: STAS domain-containing protein [Rhodanobacter sp.]|jgi:anti-anti-sigma factor|nr:STAS domain-containing protein [Rhodanobacter sp.]